MWYEASVSAVAVIITLGELSILNVLASFHKTNIAYAVGTTGVDAH